MNGMQMALIRKDLRSITTNKRLFPVLLIVPIMLTLVLPSIFILITHFAPEQMDELAPMLAMLPGGLAEGDKTMAFMDLIINRIMPVFFIIVPIMAASVMAASSFVGEKEKHTLETLLYCPMTLRQIFQAKILASLALSMLVSLTSFVVMVVAVQIEIVLITGSLLALDTTWLATMLLLAPSISAMAVSMIVRASAKAQSVEESQQRSVFLVLPVIMLVVGQFTGLLLISAWMLFALGAVCAVLAVLMIRGSYGRFTYEALLT